MKTRIIALVISSVALLQAAEIQAPNGGRIIESITPHVEFLVTPDKKVEIRFLDDTGKVVAPGDQVVTVVMGDRAAPTKLTFARDGDKLVSDKPVAEGKALPLVLQIKTSPDSKTVTTKFNLDMANCPTCKHQEYACTCDHH